MIRKCCYAQTLESKGRKECSHDYNYLQLLYLPVMPETRTYSRSARRVTQCSNCKDTHAHHPADEMIPANELIVVLADTR